MKRGVDNMKPERILEIGMELAECEFNMCWFLNDPYSFNFEKVGFKWLNKALALWIEYNEKT